MAPHFTGLTRAYHESPTLCRAPYPIGQHSKTAPGWSNQRGPDSLEPRFK
jgi:hypothetical protein